MRYLIMKASVSQQFTTNRLDEPVGVLELNYKTATAISRLLDFTKQRLDAVPNWNWRKDPSIYLVKSEFTGPSVDWITGLGDVELTRNQKEQFERNSYVVINQQPKNRIGVVKSQSRLFITRYQQLFWECIAGEKYSVYGPPTTKWERIANHAIQHLLSKAKKEPLSWEDARRILRCSAFYPIEPVLSNEDVARAFCLILKNDHFREKFTPVEILQMQVFNQHKEAG